MFGYETGSAEPRAWKSDEPVVAALAALEVGADAAARADAACRRLGACGLSSVPSWLRPYDCLSNGEAARVDLACALARHATDRERWTRGAPLRESP